MAQEKRERERERERERKNTEMARERWKKEC